MIKNYISIFLTAIVAVFLLLLSFVVYIRVSIYDAGFSLVINTLKLGWIEFYLYLLAILAVLAFSSIKTLPYIAKPRIWFIQIISTVFFVTCILVAKFIFLPNTTFIDMLLNSISKINIILATTSGLMFIVFLRFGNAKNSTKIDLKVQTYWIIGSFATGLLLYLLKQLFPNEHYVDFSRLFTIILCLIIPSFNAMLGLFSLLYNRQMKFSWYDWQNIVCIVISIFLPLIAALV
jgi:hypothetical protein